MTWHMFSNKSDHSNCSQPIHSINILLDSLIGNVKIAGLFDNDLGQITVLPVFLTNGMEFDCVYVVDYHKYDKKILMRPGLCT